jgi:hypothetical protein
MGSHLWDWALLAQWPGPSRAGMKEGTEGTLGLAELIRALQGPTPGRASQSMACHP